MAPSAPWGTLPTSHWETLSAQGLYLAGQFWNKPLRPEAWIAETHALDLLPSPERERTLARFVPESGSPPSISCIGQWTLGAQRLSTRGASRAGCCALPARSAA